MQTELRPLTLVLEPDSDSESPPQPPVFEYARLTARVRELEHQLHLERSRNAGLERGLSALSERLVALREERLG